MEKFYFLYFFLPFFFFFFFALLCLVSKLDFFQFIGIKNQLFWRGGRDHMIVGFTATCAITAYNNQRCEFESRSWRGVLDTTLNLSVTCGRSVVFSGYSGFLHQWNWSPRYNWNIVECGVKHNNLNPIALGSKINCLGSTYNCLGSTAKF